MTAADKILQKALVGSRLDTAGWSEVHAGLRDRAFVSAKIEEARILDAARRMCADVADGKISASEFRRDMRQVLDQVGYSPDGEGIRDMRTRARLDVIRETQVRQARGWAQWREGTTEGALAAFPAQELVRVRERKMPRDWASRWAENGGKTYGGRMVALKNDPVWVGISRFGVPWPPFDFGSGMGVRDIGWDEAVELGLLKDDDPPPEMPGKGFNDGLETRLPEGREREIDPWLRETFGAQISIGGDNVARWNENLIGDMLQGRGPEKARLGKGLLNPRLVEKLAAEGLDATAGKRSLTVTREWLGTHGQKHRAPAGTANLPLTPGDYGLIPSMWRQPTTAKPHGPGKLELTFDTLDGNRLVLGVNLTGGTPTTFYKTKAAEAPSPA